VCFRAGKRRFAMRALRSERERFGASSGGSFLSHQACGKHV
jgi:hypothetical protein